MFSNERHRTVNARALPVLTLGLSLSAVYIAPLQAQSPLEPATVQGYQVRDYQLPAGKLTNSLKSLARQAGMTLSVDAALVEGKTTTAITGVYSVEQVLQKLLASTQLQFARSGNTITLIQKNSDVMVLSPLTVNGVVDVQNSLESASTNVGISYEALQRSRPADLKDVFTKESSVAVGGSIPVNQKLYLRGIEETALSVTVDGARQNNKVFHHNATTLIDPALLKSVRASAGISPADDGPGAIGGSIVFETVDVADVLTKNDPLGGFMNVAYNSSSDTLTTGASLYGQQQGVEALIFVNRVSGDDYEDGNGDTVKYSESDLLSGLAKIAYETEQGNRFELSHETVNDDAARPYRANFGGLTVGRPTPESREYDLTRTNTVFSYTSQAGGRLWNPKIVIADSETELTTTEVSLADSITQIRYTGITESRSLLAQNLFITDFAEITAGVDFYDDGATFLYAGDPNINEEAENTGVFVQFRQTLNQLNLSYGLRYDQQGFTGTDGSKLDDSGVSANIFVDYSINKYLTVKAGYASVWGGIALAENFILNPSWDYTDGIKSVESDNFVVGVESAVGDFQFGANVYETDITNGRTPSYRAGPGVMSDFDITGHDVFISYTTINTALNLKYSNIKADKDGGTTNSFDGNYFTAPLGQLITLSGTTSFEELPLTLGASAEISLENEFEAYGVQSKQEDYIVVNVYADYQVSEKLNLRFTVNNIADEAYVDRASYGQEFPTVEPLFEPGRAIILNAKYQF